MYTLPLDKIDVFFEAAAAKGPLYIPVDNDSGKADFKDGQKVQNFRQSALKTVRSAKDFFFPKTETLVSYKVAGKKIEIDDPRKELEDFTVFGVRACDAASFDIVDNVYIKQTPCDTYYKNRREHGTVITLACSDPAQTCFCALYKYRCGRTERRCQRMDCIRKHILQCEYGKRKEVHKQCPVTAERKQ
jgi:sulfhydrogenase subunit beta (sulfur reductase)